MFLNGLEALLIYRGQNPSKVKTDKARTMDKCNSWTEAMKTSLKNIRSKLIDNLAGSMQDLMDLLVEGGVFQDTENIMNNTSLHTPRDRARKLMDDIPRRPDKDYWTLILALYNERIRLGHTAELILDIYEENGGAITNAAVKRARRDYQENQRMRSQSSSSQSFAVQRQQPPTSPQQQQLQPSAPEQHDGESLLPPPIQVQDNQPSQAFPTQMEFSEVASHLPLSFQAQHQCAEPSPQGMLSQGNQPGTIRQDPQASGSAKPHVPMETDADQRRQTLGYGGARPKVPNPANVPNSGDASSSCLPSTYQIQMQVNPHKVYRMASSPRGVILIIDNEHFDDDGVDDREGTEEDCRMLCELFGEYLGFQVIVCKNLTGKEMDDTLVWFAEYLQRKEVDSCAVAFLTHGGREEVLFGRDGKFVRTQTSEVQPGTYIKTSRLREVFSTSRCRAMQGKPKLFIIQACKGNLEDTYDGQIPYRPYPRDLPVPEDATPHAFPDQADMVFLNAAVDDYVAYRNLFIKHLVGVFRQHAATKHLLDLGTELNGRMAGETIEGRIRTISQKKDTLCKTFYLNPPNESTSCYPVITVSSYSELNKLK